jgi:hypothetical protein
MSFDSTGPLNRIVEVLGTVGVPEVYVGVPKSVEGLVAAYVTLGPQQVIDKANELLQRISVYTVTFCYGVESDPEQAERAIAAMVDDLILAVYAERDTPGSALASLNSLDLTLASGAEYQNIVGQEYRRYPVNITVLQQETLGA